jgi:hypothetical protein
VVRGELVLEEAGTALDAALQFGIMLMADESIHRQTLEVAESEGGDRMRCAFMAAALVLAACGSGGKGGEDADADATGDTSIDTRPDVGDPDVDIDPEGRVDVTPARIDDVLVNPGMGFADFHFGWWCNLPPVTFTPEECAPRVEEHWPENYPDSATAYFRWHWKDLEPVRGEIDFEMIDTAMQSANVLGETLSFRVMTIDEGDAGVPGWLTAAPYDVPGEWIPAGGGDTFWPDYRSDVFLGEHERFVSALGERYDGHPALDHVDIGTVGCWGEWNTACLTDVEGIFEVFHPASDTDRDAILAAYSRMIDDHIDAFPTTPTVMLGMGSGWELETMLHATDRGAGWRVDCWGDWGFFGTGWNHMEDAYPVMIENAIAADPAFADLWRTAPIQLEVCGVMADWYDFGWTVDAPDGEVYRTFRWALDVHASVLNAKFNPVPASYVDAVDDLLRENGYRFVVDLLDHDGTVAPGAETTLVSSWSNIGVAPAYNPRTLTYRLRGATRTETFASTADTTGWLPGPFTVVDTVTIPADMPGGTYDLEIALLDRAGTDPDTDPLAPLYLGIEGRRTDGWYPISRITVSP